MDTLKETSSTELRQPRLAGRALPLPGLEQLWVLLALTLIGTFIALVPTPPHDFWWHLKAGQIVAEQVARQYRRLQPADLVERVE